ncbi:hemolysin-III related-domain-containing protein [Aspergillus varians]
MGVQLYSDLHVRYSSCTREDIYAFAAFIPSAATCFLLSAFCHPIASHSHTMSKIGTSMDYLGIVVFIEGTCLSGFYYGLWEHMTLLYWYWIMVIPILHGIYLYGFETLEKRMGLRWFFVQGFFYILGCVIFASRVPERWRPGRYDIFRASHQIFHLCTLAAAASQLKALMLAFDYIHSQSGSQDFVSTG